MSDIVYLTVAGEQQGAISDGCGTVASVGNRNQIGHEDEIFTFSLTNSVTSTGKGSQLHGLRFCKLIDKSTPLFVNAINKNEQLYMEFCFYRINQFCRWEKYYYIQLRGAFISGIYSLFKQDSLYTETIAIDYEYILCKHLIANTEFSYLALPANYNHLFVPAPKASAGNDLKMLNSKSVGRLLAAGGIYNGNIEGFKETSEKLGGDVPAGYDQVMDNQGLLIAGVSLVAGLNLGGAGSVGALSTLYKNEATGVLKVNGLEFNVGDLAKTGRRIDPADTSGKLTVAGRALQKHGSRDGSAYPMAKGTPFQINEQGQTLLDDMAKSSNLIVKEGNRFGGFDIIAPDGKGFRFGSDGNFRGFLEP